MRLRLVTLTAALLSALAPLAAQEKSDMLERAFGRDRQKKSDIRFGFSLGMAQASEAQTKSDLASSGRGADVSMGLDFPLHNGLVLGGRMGGLWLRERNEPWLYSTTVNSQTKGFYLGFETKYFFMDPKALKGPYVVGAAQWTRWKKYWGLDLGGNNIGDAESMDKTAFTPAAGLGWHINRMVALEGRYTRSRFREEYDDVPGYSRDWNFDHFTFAVVLRGGGKHL